MAATTLSRPTFYLYFSDLHELMEALLAELEAEVLQSAALWKLGEGERTLALRAALQALVKTCYRRGPLIRAIFHAAPLDQRLETAWENFLSRLDVMVAAQIEAEQASGLVPPFEAMPVAISLNRMDVLTFVKAFGRHPRARPDRVLESIVRIWTGAIYPPLQSAGETAPADSIT
jgi:AcrR family transcriptional regulator